MKHLLRLIACLALLAGCARGGQPTDHKSSGLEQRLVELRGMATAVDRRPRILAPEGDDVGTAVLRFPEDFRDVDNRAGDPVGITYSDALTLALRPVVKP